MSKLPYKKHLNITKSIQKLKFSSTETSNSDSALNKHDSFCEEDETMKHPTITSYSLDLNSSKILSIPHQFVKKTFNKPNYCHQCCEFLWGFINQGYICSDCNFVCHERCINIITCPCPKNKTLSIKKTNIPHFWSESVYCKRKFCNYCRKRIDQTGYFCIICNYHVHGNCRKTSGANCRYTYATYKKKSLYYEMINCDEYNLHHWIEGNLNPNNKCYICRKSCYNVDCLTSYNCTQCDISVHFNCLVNPVVEVPKICCFGLLYNIILPTKAVLFPFEGEKNMSHVYRIHEKRTSPLGFSETSTSGGIDARNDEEHTIGTRLKNYKDKDDASIRVYDGLYSVKQGSYHSCSITNNNEKPMDILTKVLCYYKIIENKDEYFLTELTTNDIEFIGNAFNEVDPIIKQVKFVVENRRALVYLRHIPQKDVSVPCYIMRYDIVNHMKTHFSQENIRINECTTSMQLIETYLKSSGLEHELSEDYELFYVVSGLKMQNVKLVEDEKPLHLYNSTYNHSVLLALRSYFLVKMKENESKLDTISSLSRISVYVVNFPNNLSEKKYKQIIDDYLHLSNGDFIEYELNAIYHEFGTIIISFENSKDANIAIQRFQSVTINDKQVYSNLLPIINEKMIPDDVVPLLVLINVKSGGQQGQDLIKFFRRVLNPHQIFDLMNGGPLPAFYAFRNVPKYRVFVCGGDGSIGWALRCLDNVGQDAVCSSPPIAILPLGTGNDMARVMNWGSGYSESDDLYQILSDVKNSSEADLDRWTVMLQPHQKQNDKTSYMDDTSDRNLVVVMNSYCGIGIDAEFSLSFHKAREQNPDKFNSRLRNKGAYFLIGLRKFLNYKPSTQFRKNVKLFVDGEEIIIPIVEGILISNIMSWGSGANAWGSNKNGDFNEPTYSDHLLEIIGFSGIVHMAQIKSGLRSGIRIAQGENIKISLNTDISIQIDGEPWRQSAGELVISRSALKAKMLIKPKTKARLIQSSTDSGLVAKISDLNELRHKKFERWF
ncbi:hypothetical protein A3Q56_03404 [Intoshia linei]|uniref:Diacylglycerol kinase n=1 Tax=Intoshia linei TaxID=1819745 RepID=A0A177B3M4_9BILA|nr:hypothetical protein A3Q56_03404 [Intoshia linei]